MMSLASDFLRLPIAHRGLHDLSAGKPENSLPAFEAACALGYGIELDVQPAADGTPMVFHDDTLDRLTDRTGRTDACSAAELTRLHVLGTQATVPTLAQTMDLVAGRVPLLIEIKDQSGPPKTATNALTTAVIETLQDYTGPVAIMSFNPFAMAHGASIAPELAWGITTGHGNPLWVEYPDLDAEVIQAPIDPRTWGGCFISHGLHGADDPWLAGLRDEGVPILSWTIRSLADEAKARGFATNITFEGYLPAIPAPDA